MRHDHFLPDFSDVLLLKTQKEITSDFVIIMLELWRLDDGF